MTVSTSRYLFALVLALSALLAGPGMAADAAPPCLLALDEVDAILGEAGPDAGTRAMDICQAAFGRDPTCVSALNKLTLLAMEARDWPRAQEALETLTQIRPGDAEVSLALAAAYLEQDKDAWAVRTLQPLTDRNDLSPEQNRRVSLLLATLAYRMDDCASSREHLDRMVQDAETRSLHSAVEAVCAQKQGRHRQAMAAAEDVRSQGGVPAVLAPQVEEAFDRAFRDSLEDPWLSVALKIGGGYDSNPVLEPEDINVVSGSPGAGFLELSGDVSGSLKFSSRHLPGARASISRLWNFDQQADDYNRLAFSFNPFYRYRFRSLGTLHNISVGYRLSLSTLDGGPLVEIMEDEGFYVYHEAHGGQFDYWVEEGDWGVTRVSLNAGYSLYHHMARNGLDLGVSLSQTIMLYDQKFKLRGSLSAGLNDADRQDYDAGRVGVFVGVSALLPYQFQLMAWVRVNHKDYFRSADSPSWATRRKDDYSSVSLSVSRPVWRELAVGIDCLAAFSRSTVKSFTYDRYQVSGFVAWSYSL